ncbi:uncharacterized protein Z520_04142 [Fonsecaea multimorphosa CBS 102226]|uniref:ribose-phosphate diphosphokinase n=1 Tax=Fonsecaea multimorphosa CBS 102226 TaxID=1442371 RepID=A0A0D2IU11_9EURO|nr:uncharacterized protein Z520_04142 [Fonsecaea multimorphosa CBS 102226]KIY00457.1 hypothetical protein Z520_04142 [Fonsecaea multimorphosa CBS 102226]
MLGSTLKILAGSSHPELAQLIAQKITRPIGALQTRRFANGETLVTVVDSVRDQDVFIIQTAAEPVNDLLMELLITINACKIASARQITVVLPCFPYARQDKKDRSRAPITAKLVANMLQTAGCNHVITMDLHASQIQGFFDIPLYSETIMRDYIQQHYEINNVVIVSPDAGGAKRAAYLADKLKVDFALIHKERQIANEVSRMILVGNVTGKTAIIIDDIADTCGTIALASKILTDNGAEKCIALVVHAFLSGRAIEVIANSALDEIVVANTIPLSQRARDCSKLRTMDVSAMLGEAIRRTHYGES